MESCGPNFTVPPSNGDFDFFQQDERQRERVLRFVQKFGNSANFDCAKCEKFPLGDDELILLENYLENVGSIGVYNSSLISRKCWVEIKGFSQIFDVLKKNKERKITIFEPPQLALIVLETLNANYKISTTRDGPFYLKART